MSATTGSTEQQLLRAVGLKEIIALTVNGIIGAGIFALPATTAALLGAASPLAFIAAGVFMMIIVLCFAELGSRYDRTGGAYLYASEAFGGSASFVIGWMYVLARVTSVAALSSALAGFAGFFLELAPPFRQLFSLAVLGVLGWINYLGIRSSTRVINALTIAKIIPLLLFIAAGITLCRWDAYRNVSLPSLGSFSSALLVCMFAFSGFEVIAIPGAEMTAPRKDIPKGILIGSLIAIVVYVLIQVTAVAALPRLAASQRPLAEAASAMTGPTGGVILTIGAICSTIGTLTSLLLVGPRILFAMSVGQQMPELLARVHTKFRTPHVSLLAFLVPTAALTVLSDFTNLATLSAMARLVTYIGSALALLVLRKKHPLEKGFRVPGGPLLPLLTVLISMYLLSAATREQWISGSGALAAGLLLYAVTRRARKAR